MTGTEAQRPHVLTLWLDDEFDPEMPSWWDRAELACPHEPSELMPCAVWTTCGCEPVAYEAAESYVLDDDETDPLIGHPGLGPCPRSATGAHHYWEGEPNRPDAECWPTLHADDLDDAARELNLPPGRYEVSPFSDGDGGMTLTLAEKVAS